MFSAFFASATLGRGFTIKHLVVRLLYVLDLRLTVAQWSLSGRHLLQPIRMLPVRVGITVCRFFNAAIGETVYAGVLRNNSRSASSKKILGRALPRLVN
jgi:hypothetical protein